MKYSRIFLTSVIFLVLITSCYQDLDDVIRPSTGLEIKEFIWRGMNHIYLYKSEVPALADDRFPTDQDLHEYLETFSSPEDLFYDGLVAPQDEFSFLVDDYVELERVFDGIHRTHGMQFGLRRYSSNSTKIFGYVRYVLPHTSAEEKGVKRGDLFTTVDGVQLTLENYRQLLEPMEYVIGLARRENDILVPTGESIELEKRENSTNPVYLTQLFNLDNSKVGYLVYHGFTGSFDPELNAAFGMFKAEGITDLIVDLRYNGGGSVESAGDLASMITGQYREEIFYTEQWNEEYQQYFLENDPEALVNRFNDEIRTGEEINSLNLDKVYVITSQNTASASELLINSLDPYIQVVQVGDHTTGKFQASTTLYDSPDFGRLGANTGHTYAIQPLIYKTLNVSGHTDYHNGLPPDVLIVEDIDNLGILGDAEEPLLRTALDHIRGIPQAVSLQTGPIFEIEETHVKEPLYQKMYRRKEIMPLLPIKKLSF